MQFLEDGQHNVEGWWLDIDTVNEPHWPRLESLLEQAERDRAQRFHFEHDKKSYIAAHAIVRSLLSARLDASPTEWKFSISDLGKPEVILPKGVPRVRINLAHTRGMVVAALTTEHDIGVDVEWLGRKSSFLDLSKSVFTLEEQSLLAAAPEGEKHELFLTLWTLKEAYIKAIGKGLSLPLDSFHYSLEPLAIQFKQTREDIALDDPAQWSLHRFRPGPDHIAAIAVHHPQPDGLSVSFEEAPLQAILNQSP